MAQRQRISKTSKQLILATAICVDVLSFLFGLVALIPIVGILGTAGDLLLSFVWTITLTLWLISIGSGLKRLWVRAQIIAGLQVIELLLSLFPFLGAVVSAGVMFANTLLIYFLIRKIEEEDAEYNKLQERMAKELQRAGSHKERSAIEARYAEEERKLKEKSVLNKKNA